MKKIFCLLPLCLALHTASSQQSNSNIIQVNIDLQKTAQTIRNFAASDAWAGQFTGNWPDSKRNQIADWLFSTDTTAGGQPKGIGLSMWRFNIGAGSAEQGNNSGIKDEWRRAESFLQENNTYNWKKQSGQLWFLQAAKQRGVTRFLGFLNSPPVAYTLNGKAFADKGLSNLPKKNYTAVALFLKDVIQGIHSATGVQLNYISPVNEPQWDWSDGGQEGCPYNNEQIAGFTKAISKTFSEAKLPTKILVTEAGKINYLYAAEDKPDKGSQINAFFAPHSAAYIGNLPNVYKGIAAHSYFTTSPEDTAITIRKRLHTALNGLEFWQSEYCILGDNAGEINGSGADLGMDAALYMARVIHSDLTIANAAAWQWWLAISPYNYKDGLIYIDKNKTDGQPRDSKMMWVLGNYSRFIRPGAKRVQADMSNSAASKDLYLSAYKNKDNTLRIVVINNGSSAATAIIHCKGLKPGGMRSYTTSSAGNLQPGDVPGNTVVIPPRSVVTLTGNIKQ
ncbi:glycoside hydrolase [Chitinophaga polysaccharea]|uniref:glycoside hydrolase n=1 Tax=Chitinophaga polysaccharea TaxID=1293035 RepID=UPI001159BE5A|nr:glycoside hydrolase [Chitinophaga polysaccharea]